MPDSDFIFRVGPHAIEDLGSNLYTSFPRVLAEFVANAYDADASKVNIKVDFEQIRRTRDEMRRQHAEQVAESATGLTPLVDQFLPPSVQIEIQDDGFGMTKPHLKDRFLWTAKRRRTLEPIVRTKAGRPLMGRKGLGKLAGFGVARVMEVVTRHRDETNGWKVTLDYDEILKEENITDVPVPGGESTDDFGDHETGTIIRLRKLSFDAVKSRPETVATELSEQFEFIEQEDFKILLNDIPVPPPVHDFAFAWPEPGVDKSTLIDKTIDTEHGNITFQYRIRFRPDRGALPAAKRGVRVYASNRMAATPSLFDADTNMHGFRMTDYMDGVVKADFIDTRPQDYIATNRQSLKWDTPLLSPLRDFVSAEIKEACKQYQKVRDEKKRQEVREDPFTTQAIASQPLSNRERRIVTRLAVDLARLSKKGVEDEKYRNLLPDIVRSFGQGNLYSNLSSLAESQEPDVKELLAQVIRLNRLELDRSTAIVKSRLKAIQALTKEIRKTPEAGGPRNEAEIQKIFEEAPWLIDPLYRDYLTADKSMSTTLKNLAAHLKIANPIAATDVQNASAREPDFVFILGDNPLHFVVVVEIKASNKQATVDDVLQLRSYMDTARKWLADNGHGRVSVRGELICTKPSRESTRREHQYFHMEVDQLGPGANHRVRSYTRVLEDTEAAHADILKFAEEQAAAESETEESIEPSEPADQPPEGTTSVDGESTSQVASQALS
jgi:hypothetical protein